MGFFNSLNFSSSNEDGLTELTALAGPSKRMLCLTGSGTRPLDMLLSDAKEIIAIDVNPIQNALLQLKIAAFQTLTHRELLQYLGLKHAQNRIALHAKVVQNLSPKNRDFWAKRGKLIRAGVWYAGRWEKVLRFGAFGIKLLRGSAVETLFAASDVAEQSDIWARKFDDRIWRGSIRMLGRPWIWTHIIGEPGGAFLPSPDAVETRLAGAFRQAAQTFLFRDSDFASLILRGTNGLPSALPQHLRPEHFEAIKAALPRLRIVQGDLTDLARHDIANVDRFSLSDFGSYCTADAYAACWAGISDKAIIYDIRAGKIT